MTDAWTTWSDADADLLQRVLDLRSRTPSDGGAILPFADLTRLVDGLALLRQHVAMMPARRREYEVEQLAREIYVALVAQLPEGGDFKMAAIDARNAAAVFYPKEPT